MRYIISLHVHKTETQACIANEDEEVVAEKRFRMPSSHEDRGCPAVPHGGCPLRVCGLVPRVRQSGDSVVHGRITKQGPSTLRYAVEMGAGIAIRYDNPLGQKYRALRQRGKKASVAKTAIAHKLLRVIHAMLSRAERCRWEDRHSTEFKVMMMQRRSRARKVPAG